MPKVIGRMPKKIEKAIFVGLSFLVVLCALVWSRGVAEEQMELLYTGGIRSLYHSPMNTVEDSIEMKIKSFSSKLNKFKSQTHDLRAKETHFKLAEESSLNDISSAQKLTFQKFMDVDHALDQPGPRGPMGPRGFRGVPGLSGKMGAAGPMGIHLSTNASLVLTKSEEKANAYPLCIHYLYCDSQPSTLGLKRRKCMTDVCVLIAGRPGDEGARGLEGRGVYPHA